MEVGRRFQIAMPGLFLHKGVRRCLPQRTKLLWAVILLGAIAGSGCKSSNSFGFFEETPESASGEIKITNYIPSADPVVITSAETTTFAVTLSASAGDDVAFVWSLDGVDLYQGSNSFYELSGTTVTQGAHQLVVKASNTKHSASHSFNLRKNTPPQVTSSNPTSTGNTVNVGSTLSFSATATDADSEAITFAWKFNGASASSLFSVTSTATTSSAVFTPTAAQVGSGLISLEVSDGHETTSHSWAVDVINPIVASINSYAPVASPVIITASGSVDFSISATAKTPTTYRWVLDGSTIGGAASALYTLSGAGLTIGNHTLVAIVEDSDSSDSHTFTIKRNGPPVISNPTAAPTSLKINYKSQMTLAVDATDPNSDALNYSWKIDANTSSTLSASNTAGGSQVVFQPTSVWTGDHTISVVVSDGVEQATYSWSINVNRFSESCNQAAAGKICTLVGNPSVGNGLKPTDDQSKIKVEPRFVIDDGSGNWIFSDLHNDSIWYYNRSGASINRLGKTIAAGAAVVVLGNGAPGKTNEYDSNTNFKLYNPDGIAYDSANDRLFVADYNNHRVVMLATDGQARTILGTGGTGQGGVTNADDTSGTTHVCGAPRDVHYRSPYVYVTCSSTHAIKRVDPSSGLARVVVGAVTSGSTSAGTGDGTTGSAGAAKVSGPQGLSMDTAGNLYWTEVNGNNCRLRVWNTTASSLSYFGGGVTAPAGQATAIVGATNACGYTTGAFGSARLGQAYDVQVLESGGIVGFALASYNYHRVMFVNNTNGNVSLGGQTISAYSASTFWGTGTATYNGDNSLANLTRVGYPLGISLSADGVNLLLGDYYNQRIRKMNTGTGLVATDVGQGRLRHGMVGGADEDASDAVINRPYDMSIDTARNILYFTDSLNYRIRQVNLTTGLVSTILGEGTGGDGNVENEDPLNIGMRDPRSIVPFGDHLLFSDATSNNCLVRAHNRSATAQTLFGVTISAYKVSTIAGNFINGCGTFSGANGPALSSRLRNPEGIISDGTNLYIADSVDDCILKVDNTGTISQHIGTCSSSGLADGPLSSAKLDDPTTMLMDPSYPGTGNMFIVDQTNATTSRVRYANLTGSAVTIAGVNVNANSMNTIFYESGTPRFYGLAAFGNQLCYSSGHTNGISGNHNVICRDRSTGLAPVTLRVGSAQGDVKGSGGPLHTEQEGADPLNVVLNKPSGIAFDSQGNLYIIERNNSLVRKVLRWF